MDNTFQTTRNAGILAPNRVLVGLMVAIVLIAAGGCDRRPSRVPVSGQVTVDGEPLEFGSITFYAVAGGRPGGASLADGGNYSVTMHDPNDGLPPGKYTVTVAAADWVSDKACRWHAPKHYQDAKTSGLTAEIKNEATTMNFNLTWKGDSHGKSWVEKF